MYKHAKLILCLFVITLFSFSLTSISSALAAPLKTRGAILMNLDTVKVLYEQDAGKKIPPASLTKVMTMYLVFEDLKAKKISLSTKVKISSKAANTEGSSMGLVRGEYVTVEKLLTGMAVASGNDACVAIAEHIAGSERAFVKRMNDKARRLNMKNTVFKNSSGLPAKGQFTTAKDMLALSRNYIMLHPEGLRYHSKKHMYHRGVKKINKHPQLGNYRGTDGLKTGWTRASGYNIISTSRQGKVRLIAVILGAETSKVRAKELNRLMNAGFRSSKRNTSVYKLLK